jgi:hypothetical protein
MVILKPGGLIGPKDPSVFAVARSEHTDELDHGLSTALIPPQMP